MVTRSPLERETLGSIPSSAAVRLSFVKLSLAHCLRPFDKVFGWQKSRRTTMPYFVYILRISSNNLYTGQTDNLEKRIKEHKNKSSKSARYMRYFPSFKLVYYEKYPTRQEVMRRESQLKRWSRVKSIH